MVESLVALPVVGEANEENNYANTVTVKINSDTLQYCYNYTESLGYEIKYKDKYKSVLLGKPNIDYVNSEDD